MVCFGIHRIYNFWNFLVISLIPLNPNLNTTSGWKSENAGKMKCNEKNGKEFIKCVEDNSYASMNMTSDAEHLYVDYYNAISQILQMEPGDISNDPRTTIHIAINDSLTYHIIVSDPKMQWTLYKSADTPQTYLDLFPSTPRSVGFYMKVSSG